MEHETKEEAEAAGANKYYPGTVCSNGHSAARYLNGACVECRSDTRKRYAANHPDKIKAYQESYRDNQNLNHKQYRDAHKEDRLAYHRQYMIDNPDKAKQYRKQYRSNNSDAVKLRDRAYWLKANYGITLEQYDALLDGQHHSCAICGTDLRILSSRPHLDHDHETGAVRGILCHHCNVGLGHFRDDITVLESAIEYLRKSLTLTQN